MAGNTRGKLKERFDGIHKNFGWVAKHLDISLGLIEDTLRETTEFAQVKGNPEQEQAFFNDNPMYQACKALAEGTVQLDSMAKGVYELL